MEGVREFPGVSLKTLIHDLVTSQRPHHHPEGQDLNMLIVERRRRHVQFTGRTMSILFMALCPLTQPTPTVRSTNACPLPLEGSEGIQNTMWWRGASLLLPSSGDAHVGPGLTGCCCSVASVVSNSVRPHRRQPTRLPHPWDSPGKNTGVGCHFLLQRGKGKVKVKSLGHVRLLVTPWTAAHQAPLSMGFSRREYWSGLPLPSPGSQETTNKRTVTVNSVKIRGVSNITWAL